MSLQALPMSARCSPRTTGVRLPSSAAPRRAAAPVAAARRSLVVKAGRPPIPYGPLNTPEPGPERNEWPFPTFIARTLAKFPDAGVATVEEARVLEEEGDYTFLDVRSVPEYEYKITRSVNVPIINAVWKWDSAAKCKMPVQSINPNFVKDVQAKFKPDAKLIVVCSDGRTRTLSALRALDEAGFVNLVGMRNGYNGFSRVFDAKFNRRVDPDAMKEVNYSDDFPEQSTGIFGTGASYDRVDSVPWVPIKDPLTWLVWEDELEKLAAAK